jgi:hypothetical protein
MKNKALAAFTTVVIIVAIAAFLYSTTTKPPVNYLQDGITRVILDPVPVANAKPAPLQTTTSKWIPCASEGQTCTFSTSDVHTVRFGDGGKYYFVIVSGLSSIPCNTDSFGDPDLGNSKSCEYLNESVLPVDSSAYTKTADEGGNVTIMQSSEPQWIRYGLNGAWVYALLDSSGPNTIVCGNDFFGIDPASGSTKQCQLGPSLPQQAGSYTDCASEGQTCSPATGETVIVQYGTSGGYIYKLAHADALSCSNQGIGYDPASGADKHCGYKKVSHPTPTTVGTWTQVASCSGKGCPISAEVTWGTEHSNSWETAQEWGVEVTTSVETDLTVGAKVSATVSSHFAQSSAFTSALARSKYTTVSASCEGDPDATNRSLYQFSTTTNDECFFDGDCSGQTFLTTYICVSDPGAGYDGPQCVPGYCSDAACSTCNYPQQQVMR